MKNLLNTGIVVLLAVYATVSAAQGSSPRAGKWEFTLQPQYTDSIDTTSSNGSRAEIDSTFGFGLGFTYNFNDHFALGGDFTWSQADYAATVVPDAANPGSAFTVSGDLETSTLRMNAVWNFLSSAFTPFVLGGIGATYVNTDVPDGPPSTVCWYDPWWGYYCGTSVPTKDDTYFSYLGGAGLRWDSQGNFFLRGLVARQWVDVGGGIGTLDVTQYRVDLGFKF